LRSHPETELLLLCARHAPAPDATARAEEMLRAGIDWDSFLSLASRHGALPLIYRRLNESFSTCVPENQLSRFRERYRRNAARNLFLTCEMSRVLDALERAGVEAIPYKGPAVAMAAYGDTALRQFLDLDILVRPRDVSRATVLLVREGFTPHFDLKNAREQEAFQRLSYVQLFTRADDAVAIELHWNVAPRFFNFPLRVERLWEYDGKLTLAGRQARAIAPELLVLLLCVHGNKDLWARLEWVCGVDALIRRERGLAWGRLLKEAESMDAQRILLLGLFLAQDLLAASLPAEVVHMIDATPAVAALGATARRKMFADEPRLPTLLEQVKFHLRSKDSLRDRIIYCARLALTTTPVDWAAINVPPSLSFVHALVRPLRLAKKYLASPARRAS
jgi:hypothetical protein